MPAKTPVMSRAIAFADWRQSDLNPWRLAGYRRALRDARLPRRRRWEIPAELNEAGAAQDQRERGQPSRSG